MIGKALIVAWSFTLTGLGPTPQIVNLGVAPTQEDYAPIEMVFRHVDPTDIQKITISLGTSEESLTNVLAPITLTSSTQYPQAGVMTYGIGGNSIVPAGQNLYTQFSTPQQYEGTPIQVDVLAYPTN